MKYFTLCNGHKNVKPTRWLHPVASLPWSSGLLVGAVPGIGKEEEPPGHLNALFQLP